MRIIVGLLKYPATAYLLLVYGLYRLQLKIAFLTKKIIKKSFGLDETEWKDMELIAFQYEAERKV